MISPNNIHPPKNWQDFEMLCLKLWGEIWNIPDEIDFNSDNSQGQNGVDIYGPVEGGLKYNGIQCKNKKLNLIDGSPNRLTISDIQVEIEKAKGFMPALNKLIIATSLPKDGKIEEYVRIQSIENLNAGLFSIQICFWEFFERKLSEYQKIYDWYLKNENFHRVSSVAVTFSNGKSEIVYHPKFQKTVDQYFLKQEKEDERNDLEKMLWASFPTFSKRLEFVNKYDEEYYREMLKSIETSFEWYQNFWFKLSIINTGQSVIQDFKLELDFEGEFIKVGRESPSHPILAENFSTDIRGYGNTVRSLWVKPDERTLVQGDSYTADDIYLKPEIGKECEIAINWRLLARDFEDEGKLTIKVQPRYHKTVNEHYVTSMDELKDETVSYSLIKRPGNRDWLGRVNYTNKESDYTFE